MHGIIFILDKSGSMSWGIRGNDNAPYEQQRIYFAKEALIKNIKNIDNIIPTGLVLLPYEYSCDVKLKTEMEPGNKRKIIKIVEKVEAPWTPNISGKAYGGTPLAKAIDVACYHACTKFIDTNIIILSDGEETCGGDVVSTIQKWQGLHVQIQVNAIGFVLDYSAQKQLETISKIGNGNYLDARNEKQLNYAVGHAIKMLPPPN